MRPIYRNYENHFMQALKLRRLISNDFAKVWASGIDVLLTPVTLTEAPRYADFSKKDNREQCATQDYCTQPANLAGIIKNLQSLISYNSAAKLCAHFVF